MYIPEPAEKPRELVEQIGGAFRSTLRLSLTVAEVCSCFDFPSFSAGQQPIDTLLPSLDDFLRLVIPL